MRIPKNLPEATNLVSSDPRSDFIGISKFTDMVINMTGFDFGICVSIDGKDDNSPEVRLAYISWALQVLAVEATRVNEVIEANANTEVGA